MSDQLFGKNSAMFLMGNLVKTLVMADCANAYSSIASGYPRCVEKQLRISLSCIRDMTDVLNISFVDKDFNLADSSTKEYGLEKIATAFLDSGYFKVGFLGRKELAVQKERRLKDA